MKKEALKYYEEGIECGVCILLAAAQKNCRAAQKMAGVHMGALHARGTSGAGRYVCG